MSRQIRNGISKLIASAFTMGALAVTLTAQSASAADGLKNILSQNEFNAMFPQRNGFYTYDALIAASNTFPAFATTGDADTRKREAAAFLANVAHETTGLQHVEEVNKAPYCDTSWGPPGCGCAAGKQYFGRGPLQISWNGNYCSAGNALGVDLKNNPELVSNNPTVSWRAAFWFWMTQKGVGDTITPHDAIVSGKGFGQTIRSINGALECNGKNPAEVQDRVNRYKDFTHRLHVNPGANLDC